MVGMWGYAGTEPANERLLNELAHQVSRGGIDAWGVWSDGQVLKGISRFTFTSVRTLHRGRTVIGHVHRGAGQHMRDVQPLVSGRAVVAHHGLVRNYSPALREELQLHTLNESEAIVSALDRAMAMGSEPPMAWHEMRAVLDLGTSYTLATLVDGNLYLRSSGRPLYGRLEGEGLYWCTEMPGPGWQPLTAYAREAWHPPDPEA